MHSIEELKRQLEAAVERSRAASEAAKEAKQRYHDAVLEATGFKGCIAEYTVRRGWGSRAKTTTERFLATAIGSYDIEAIRGPNIKADGTIGVMDKQCKVSDARNLGPYVAKEAP